MFFPQQRKNPFNSSKLPEDHLSQQTKKEQSANGRTGFFQTSKEGKYYFYRLDIFISAICWRREILRVLLTKITFKRKWKVLVVFLFCSPHWFPGRKEGRKEAHILEARGSCIPALELNWEIFWPEAFSHSLNSFYWTSTICRLSSTEN